MKSYSWLCGLITTVSIVTAVVAVVNTEQHKTEIKNLLEVSADANHTIKQYSAEIDALNDDLNFAKQYTDKTLDELVACRAALNE